LVSPIWTGRAFAQILLLTKNSQGKTMLTRLRIGARMYAGFGILVLLSAALIGVGWFGLNVAVKSLDGITGKLIPVNVITASAKYGLLESRAEQNAMLASFGEVEGIKAAKANWDKQQVVLDKAMADFGAAVTDPAQKKQLTDFAGYAKSYREVMLPFTDKLISGAYATPADARAAVAEANKSYQPMYDMLAGIDVTLQKSSGAIFAKVNGAMAAITTALLVIGALSMVLAVLLGWRMALSIVQPVKAVSVFAERMADGDLGQAPLVARGKDEMAYMTQVLGRMQQSLVDVISKVREAAEGIKLASAEVATGNHDLSARTEQAASNLEETAASMEEMSSAIKMLADSARMATQLAHEAERSAQQGGAVVGQVVSTMEEINQASRKISDIIGVIDGIAFQTNILALNAAVEAARAGEQGRGFAVVASEVRSLAQRSAEAAKEIKGLIGNSVSRVEHGTSLVGQAGNTMEEIVSNVAKVRDIIGEMSTAATEQADGVAQINAAIANLDQMTQQNAALVEQGAAAASSMSEQAAALTEVVRVFRLERSA
jgi:methyl-accepting chemotaxis protein